jgi:Prolyl oligopeptidase family
MLKHEDLRIGFEIVLGSAYRGYANVGEVLATAERVKDGDGDAWVRSGAPPRSGWRGRAGGGGAGHRVAARGLYLRAANHLSTGRYLITHFFRTPDAGPGERRPLVMLNSGSDGRPRTWGCSAGWRPWSEAVLMPVVDAMVARPDVDPGRLAVIGASQTGYWVPRALAFEHRFAAAVADPGVVDVSTSPRRCTTCSRAPRSWCRDARLFGWLARYLEAWSTMLPGANRSSKPASSAQRDASASPGTSRTCSP